MPHSIRKRKLRERCKKLLNTRIKDIQQLAQKHHIEPEVVTLTNVSLGNLRWRFSPRNTGFSGLNPALKRMDYKNSFPRYSIDSSKPLVVHGSDGGLLLVRSTIHNPTAIRELGTAVDKLPKPKNYKFRGIKRSEYLTLHLGTWAPYSKICLVSKELRDAGNLGFDFLENQQPLFNEMSRLLGQYAPTIFKQFQLYPLNEPCKRFCGAWCACVVNNGGNHANQTEAHRDVKESQYGYSCVLAAGDFRGGAVVLYELGMIVEMGPGDMLLFPDALITHRNEEAEGHRISIVAFTQENVCDYWHREHNMKLKRQEAKRRRKNAKKKGKGRPSITRTVQFDS